MQAALIAGGGGGAGGVRRRWVAERQEEQGSAQSRHGARTGRGPVASRSLSPFGVARWLVWSPRLIGSGAPGPCAQAIAVCRPWWPVQTRFWPERLAS